jgi:hypothetical protein
VVLGITSVSGDGLASGKGSDVEGSLDSGGSGRHSRFDRLQREQTHSLDLGYLAKQMSDWRGVKEIWGEGRYSQGSETLALTCRNFERTDARSGLSLQGEEALESDYG